MIKYYGKHPGLKCNGILNADNEPQKRIFRIRHIYGDRLEIKFKNNGADEIIYLPITDELLKLLKG
jgi:hypothetical protein